MQQKCSDQENIREKQKPGGIREFLGAVLLFTALIIKTVFHKQDYDTVFDAGGKAVIIVLMLVFFVIYYVQLRKADKT